MRRLLVILALASLPFAAHAQADLWRIEAFSTALNVRVDGFVDVTETIDAEFLEPRHGIYRYVPEQGVFEDGKRYDLGLRLISAKMDGADVPADESHDNGNVVWKIGWPDRTFTGEHRYVISYTAQNAIGRFQDRDEIYWNVSGEGWGVPLPAVTAGVVLPPQVPSEKIQAACYTGPYGSKEADCSVKPNGDVVGFAALHPGEALTVAVGFPKGIVAKPPLDYAALALKFGWPIVPLLTAFFMYRAWRRKGKEHDLGALVAQYDPPSGMSPAETMALLKQGANVNTLLAPTIVDLAVRGHLVIEETGTKGLFGTQFGATKDYLLRRTGNADDLKLFESGLLEDLFDDGDTTRISEMRNVFYPKARKFQEAVMDQVVSEGYFEKDPRKVRSAWVVAGIALLVISGVFLKTLPVFLALILSGAIVFIFAMLMPKWSEKGAAATAHARGFREFISAVEKYRAPWMEQQNVFEKFLPYALVFGLGEKWAKAFAGLQMQPPDWYRGAAWTAFNASAFNENLSAMATDVASAAAPRGSGSGSGGGGFSGGGGGGGGGGSW